MCHYEGPHPMTPIQGTTSTGLEAAWLQAQNYFIPPATAEIGGASFSTSLLLSSADWNFLDVALEAPPTLNPAIQKLLSEPSVLER
jgi:hypothetical protein